MNRLSSGPCQDFIYLDADTLALSSTESSASVLVFLATAISVETKAAIAPHPGSSPERMISVA